MQRNKALIPLSHDHHHGLVLARRISRDLKEGRARQIAAYVQAVWEADLKRHFDEEEWLILPLLSPADDGIRRALDEHRQMRDYVNSLGGTNDAEWPGILEAFAGLLKEHIRFE